MHLAIAIASSWLAFGGASQAQEPGLRAIPERWHGEWNEDLSACGTFNNDSVLRIFADRIEFWESAGRVRGVFTNGPLEILIVADMSGEGETWLAGTHFRMTESGDQIIMDTGDVSPLIRHRCPERPGSNQ